jgi:riboflavin kinase
MTSPGAAPFKTTGWVASGVGRGAEFLRLEWVLEELRQKLGLIPFPGTLNLRVQPEARETLFVRRASFLRIADPAEPTCPGYLQRISLRANGRACRSAYLILIIAEDNLREALLLKDADPVEMELLFEEVAP